MTLILAKNAKLVVELGSSIISNEEPPLSSFCFEIISAGFERARFPTKTPEEQLLVRLKALEYNSIKRKNS